jgi:hypothetical protein
MGFMRRLVPVLWAVLFLAGCGSGDYVEELLSDGEEMKRRMCACTDLACAQKVYDDLRAWKKGLDADKIKAAEEKLTPEQKAKLKPRFDAIDDGLESCQEKWNDKGLRRNNEGF